MTRVLQLRRGTTAQNDAFTGMPGEITFDTETKTLRIHDGATLGGYVLGTGNCGADDSDNVSDSFDINSVPDEFWANIVAQYSPAPFTVLSSGNLTVASVGYIEHIFDAIAENVAFVNVELVCQTPSAGYKIGDSVRAFGIGDFANPQPNIFTDSDGLHVSLMIGGSSFWVSHHDTGVKTVINNENWAIKYTVYCCK